MQSPLSNGWFLVVSRLGCLLLTLTLVMLPGIGCKRKQAVKRVKPSPAMAQATDDRPNDSPAPGDPGWTSVRTYEIKIAPGDLQSVESGGLGNRTVSAIFQGERHEYPGAEIRVRGSWARTWPKKALKIVFDKDDRFSGHHAVNLNSGWRDPSFVREPLAYYVFGRCGVPVPESHMVRLMANGVFHGLYIEVEQAEKPLLKRSHLKGAILYKAISVAADERDHGPVSALAGHYERASDKESGMDDLQRFCDELQHTRDPADFFNRRVDVTRYINYLAGCVLLQHWDGFNKNHYVVYDAEGSHKWFIIPWDLDRTMGDWWDMTFSRYDAPIFLGTQRMPGITGWNRMEERFLSVPSFRAQFLQRISQLLDEEFTPEKLNPILDEFEAAISSDAAADRRLWPSPAGDLHSGIEGVKRFIVHRREFLKREIAIAK